MCVLLLGGGSAYGQAIRAEDAHLAVLAGRDRLDVTAGAGVEGFIGVGMRNAVGIGPSWAVRVAYGNPQSVRVEAEYVGSQQPIRLMDVGGNLVGHGVHGLVNINLFPEARYEPFFYAGAGWSRYSVSSGGAGLLASRDDVFEMPIGIGAAYRWHNVVVDVRAGVRVTTGPDLLPSPMPEGSEHSEMMHRYGIAAQLGYSL